MAEADWSYLNDGLPAATVDRGVTAGVARPPGGGTFLFGFNSLALATGAVALFVNLPGFAPMAKGASVNDQAYLLGLSDDDPHRVVLRKGAVAGGIPPEGPGTLLQSGESFAQGTWLHLRLDAIVNGNGDVVLAAFKSDLALHPLGTPPDWQPIAGMPAFVDDQLGINAGSQPLTSGRGGFGFAVRDVTRRGFFDQLELSRQV
ncbi:MAG: hypothetical protein MUF34_38710 [Polyangiaceae bacterium]|nr:hypothetical protein [Polyangiaceae bacterium]